MKSEVRELSDQFTFTFIFKLSALSFLLSAFFFKFQITLENSNLISGQGNNVSSIRKEIIAVVNANFEID